MNKKNLTKNKAMTFIVLMGIVSLFSDMTHEGAASILGAYLSLLGASATTIGFVSGLGELVGYSLRLFTGWITDKCKKYWTMTIIGYVVDCIAIPLLGLVPNGGWLLACILIIIQRTGKAIKKPAKDTVISFAASKAGSGKSFAIQEFLDQIGAFLGPVLLYFVIMAKQGNKQYEVFSQCFLILAIPAVITIALLIVAKIRYPEPERFEVVDKTTDSNFKMKKSFIYYIVAISLFATGFIDFTLITMHTVRLKMIPESTISLLYAGAMLIDAFSALFFGWLFDRKGLSVLIISTLLSAPFAIFIFMLNTRSMLIIGVLLWGIGMGAQESIMKAAVSKIVPKQHRSKGFGIFSTAFGIFWFFGSWLMGFLYDTSPMMMVCFSLVMQLAAIPFFELAIKQNKELKKT